jgi:DNA (cytosine-5)-methyltransferase 1
MRFLSLFSGIGGADYGLEMAGLKCGGQVEIDKFCQKVLEKHWPKVKRMGDIYGVKGDEFGRIDVIWASPPCQPASQAGKRKGTGDDRWLWGETFRIVRNVKPTWCLFENVRGLLTLEHGLVFDKLLSELEEIGYELQPFIIPACGLNAPHRRDRIWIIAHSKSIRNSEQQSTYIGKDSSGEMWTIESNIQNSNASDSTSNRQYGTRENTKIEEGWKQESKSSRIIQSGFEGCDKETSNPIGQRLQEYESNTRTSIETNKGSSTGSSMCTNWNRPWPEVAAELCRVSDGFPPRMDRAKRLKALGNAVVPQIVEQLGLAIMAGEKMKDIIEAPRVIHNPIEDSCSLEDYFKETT